MNGVWHVILSQTRAYGYIIVVTFSLRCFVVGSKDMSTWVFGAERWANLIYYALGGHKDVIVGCFFEKDSLDVSLISVSTNVLQAPHKKNERVFIY